MDDAADEPHAAVLLSLLEEIRLEVERWEHQSDVAWMKPLLLLIAEIDLTAFRAARADHAALVGECRELGDLLSTASWSEREFAEGYARARDGSSRLQELHSRALMACRFLALAEAPSPAVAPRTRAAPLTLT